ncbi:WG repeat protein [Flavobacterium sp. 90]|uniref:WG repeat-containing protein n=1 Tax=unclassified Flavobacterium TaxID=196869 RepID=UPI000EAE2298|nr:MULTISPECIES: WG repeat-containing protein [unclassified Flavobacterium]RKR05341.1 WG repeat protein [Flavobacterium sp. 81]TCK56655.1 WG repeat protein [Flavobacterium sp. 90]
MENTDEMFQNDFGTLEKLNEYLNLNSLDNNLDLDNLKFKTYSISHLRDSNYLFNYNGNEYEISQMDYYEDRDFYAFSFYRYTFSSKNNLFASVKPNKVAILPFFENFIFHEKFNIIICSRSLDNIDANNLNAKQLYYFDIHSRFIKEEIGNLNTLPDIAMIENEIIPISFNRNYYLEQIHDYNLFEVSKIIDDDIVVYSLSDNNGVLYSEDFYNIIVVNKENDNAILQKEGLIFNLNLKNREIKRLPYHRLSDHNDNLVKVIINKDDSVKYGIIDFSGNEIIKPIFDFINFSLEKDKFKVFTGAYEWISNKKFNNEFDKALKERLKSPYRVSEPYLEGKLLNGKWGIINADLEYIIPAEYDWIEDYNQDLYLANIGGNIYSYTSFDLEAAENFDKEISIHDQIAILDGKWFAIHKNTLQTEETKIELFFGGELLNGIPLKLNGYYN